MSNKVLFCLKYRENSWCDDYSYSGTPLHSGLHNSARFMCELLNKNGIESKLVHVPDNNKIHKEIVEFGANIVIIEALWIVSSKFAELKKACPQVKKWVVRNHSEIPFLANEGIALEWIMDYLDYDNVIVASNAPRAHEQIAMLSTEKFGYNKSTTYLPNYFPIGKVKMQKNKFSGDVINIGCFGSVRPLKNHLIQAITAIEFAKWLGKPLNFHINGSRVEQGGSPILKNLRALFEDFENYNLIEHGWCTGKNYTDLIATMDLGMQVSFSETFNICSSDMLAQGIPVVTSSEIFWNDSFLHASPVDSKDILCKMKRAYYMSKHCPQINRSLKGLEKYNRESERIWVEYFSK